MQLSASEIFEQFRLENFTDANGTIYLKANGMVDSYGIYELCNFFGTLSFDTICFKLPIFKVLRIENGIIIRLSRFY